MEKVEGVINQKQLEVYAATITLLGDPGLARYRRFIRIGDMVEVKMVLRRWVKKHFRMISLHHTARVILCRRRRSTLWSGTHLSPILCSN